MLGYLFIVFQVSNDVFAGHAYTCKQHTRHTRFITLSVFIEVVKAKGVEQITVQELVAEITPKGRGTTHLPRAIYSNVMCVVCTG